MRQITLFEHQEVNWQELGWTAEAPYPDLLERLNESSGNELVRVGRNSIKATQYVGILHIGDLTLQVLPKIDFDPKGNPDTLFDTLARANAERSATSNLLSMLAYAEELDIHQRTLASLEARRQNWFELLTFLFAVELHKQFLQGPHRSYMRKEEYLPLIRGKWQITKQLAHRPHVKTEFMVAYDEFTMDTQLNQIFRYVVEKLIVLTADPLNFRLLATVRSWLADVTVLSRVRPGALKPIHFDRLNGRFRVAFNYAMMYLGQESMMLDAGRRPSFAFVLDMNRLFELFVAKFIKRYQRDILRSASSPLKINTQSRGKRLHLLRRETDDRDFIRLRPDIMLSGSHHGYCLIMDTKYKRLGADISNPKFYAGDLYQMLAYMTRYGCKESALIYPADKSLGSTLATFRIPNDDRRIYVASIDLHRPLDDPRPLIREFQNLIRLSAT